MQKPEPRNAAQELSPPESYTSRVGMRPSSFYQHFRRVTSPASTVAYAVGYERVLQFTREYRRLFGTPPVHDIKQAKGRIPSPPDNEP
ncbi:transcriptional regulator GlxA family with amidase domain [Rhodoligotrophos appendicifer]|uniref:hypothetical protein n=1 Tax=Rhodoligotrophos appendicifer TaxID=987056 RepID=UPI001FE9BB8B|nr:hypothetical protein [Rhodoligotrophos appendicifer]